MRLFPMLCTYYQLNKHSTIYFSILFYFISSTNSWLFIYCILLFVFILCCAILWPQDWTTTITTVYNLWDGKIRDTRFWDELWCIFTAAEHHSQYQTIGLLHYCLVTVTCVNNLSRFITCSVTANMQPVYCKSNAQSIDPPCNAFYTTGVTT